MSQPFFLKRNRWTLAWPQARHTCERSRTLDSKTSWFLVLRVAMAVAPSSRSKVATEPRRSSGPVGPFESSECCVRSSCTYAAVPLEDLLEVDPPSKQKHHTPPSKAYP